MHLASAHEVIKHLCILTHMCKYLSLLTRMCGVESNIQFYIKLTVLIYRNRMLMYAVLKVCIKSHATFD